ncbi:MAG: DUF362 domain-containing protein [Ignavibacteriales bacterium]|nr:DUF362 domain-containing protein [Ignavibacteriales bacterium]
MSPLNNRFHKNLPKFISNLNNILSVKRVPSKLIFILIGLLSTIWFLVRVIPKPSRAYYPCMKAAYPFMSGFITYFLGLTTTIFAYRKYKSKLADAKYIAAGLFFLAALLAGIYTTTTNSIPVYANSNYLLGPNNPIGEAKGIFPGRVVWEWNPDATNENCSNEFGDGWFMDKNTNMNIIDSMVTNAVLKLTGENTIKDSWDNLFKYFNNNHEKGNVSYKDGEKIFIRVNQVSASSSTYNKDTYEILDQKRYGMAETSPQVVLAILRQLVNEFGIKEENISVGDPMKHMYKHVYEMWHNEFPNVIYIDTDARLGRTAPVKPIQPSIYYSDRGSILKTNGTTGDPYYSDYFPTVITQANYMIVIPALKAHARGGVTLNAKIHFGSNLYGNAAHLHGGLVAPNEEDNNPMRTGYGLYRVQVDLMGSKYLGGNTVLFLVDGLWAGSEANDPPRKFQSAPFNGDWTSSIFMSQDQVAIESVCFDFLKAEFTADRTPFYGDYPQMLGADDYLNQAADSTYWPADFKYDPEKDGTSIGSLGVCEHWNNPIDKQYSRNLNTGNGIELLFPQSYITDTEEDKSNIPENTILYQNYPNPFNPTTTIKFSVSNSEHATIKIIDILGEVVSIPFDKKISAGTFEINFDGNNLSSGIYFCRLETSSITKTKKLILLK